MSGLGMLSAPNLFGMNNISGSAALQRLTGQDTTSGESAQDPVFIASFMEALKAVEHPGGKEDQFNALPAMNNNGLSMLYKQAMLGGLVDGFPSVQAGTRSKAAQEAASQIAVPHLAANQTPGISGDDGAPLVSAQPTASVAQVVFGTGNANLELLLKISNADTLNDRLKYVAELRDKIVDSLKKQGYNAAADAKPDKLTVDGKTFDVIKAANALGRNSGVQLLQVNGNSGTNDNEATGVVKTLFKGAEKTMNLLRKISASSSPAERKALALEMQEKLVSFLRENGYSASTSSSPDKITINGQTYDFLQNLNAPGRPVQFQAKRV